MLAYSFCDWMQPSTCASCENDAFAFYVQSYADLFSLQTILYLKRREQMLIIRSKLILVSRVAHAAALVAEGQAYSSITTLIAAKYGISRRRAR